MKKRFKFLLFLPAIFLVYLSLSTIARQQKDEGYILEREKEIAKEEPGTHDGGGLTTGYTFFAGAKDSKLVLKKRVLRPGSAIGYHLQKEEEIYYILQGNGEMQMNGKSFPVTAGDAILTLPGNSHGLKVVGNDSLTLIINYNKK